MWRPCHDNELSTGPDHYVLGFYHFGGKIEIQIHVGDLSEHAGLSSDHSHNSPFFFFLGVSRKLGHVLEAQGLYMTPGGNALTH